MNIISNVIVMQSWILKSKDNTIHASENADIFADTLQRVPEERWILMTEWYDPQSLFKAEN